MALIRQSLSSEYGTYKTVTVERIWHVNDSRCRANVAHIRQSRPDSGDFREGAREEERERVREKVGAHRR